MIWILAAYVSFWLSALLIRMIVIASDRSMPSMENTHRECEAALCAFRLLVDLQEEMYLRAALSPFLLPTFARCTANGFASRSAVSSCSTEMLRCSPRRHNEQP